MNLLLQLLFLAGAPGNAGVPAGPWIHFIWILVIFCLIVFVVWWGWTKLSGNIPEPIRTVIWVLGIVILCILVIVYILIPLMSAF